MNDYYKPINADGTTVMVHNLPTIGRDKKADVIMPDGTWRFIEMVKGRIYTNLPGAMCGDIVYALHWENRS